MVQGLVRSAVVVVVPKPTNPALELLERAWPVRIKEPQERLVGALILALGGRFARQSADRHGALGGEEDLHGTNPAGPQLIERRRVIREQFLGRAVRLDGSFEDVLGVSTVLGTQIRCCAHIKARSIIE